MKTIGVTYLGALRNGLRKYQYGRKLDIRRFNQAARLAWLGLAVLSPLERLTEILREGFEARAADSAALERRDFYLGKFFRGGGNG